MARQLVVSGNRIIAHGEDCFISMGGTVICTKTERVFQNATVVNCDCLPCDLDEVGYEYHAGEFVPCGIPSWKECAIEVVNYLGTGTAATEENPMKIPLTIDPYIIFIGHRPQEDGTSPGMWRIMTETFGMYRYSSGISPTTPFSKNGNYVTWYNVEYLSVPEQSMNATYFDNKTNETKPYEYVLIAIGKGTV